MSCHKSTPNVNILKNAVCVMRFYLPFRLVDKNQNYKSAICFDFS